MGRKIRTGDIQHIYIAWCFVFFCEFPGNGYAKFFLGLGLQVWTYMIYLMVRQSQTKSVTRITTKSDENIFSPRSLHFKLSVVDMC
jgi:hypothetical protein